MCRIENQLQEKRYYNLYFYYHDEFYDAEFRQEDGRYAECHLD